MSSRYSAVHSAVKVHTCIQNVELLQDIRTVIGGQVRNSDNVRTAYNVHPSYTTSNHPLIGTLRYAGSHPMQIQVCFVGEQDAA